MSQCHCIDSTPNTPERPSTEGPLGDILNLSQITSSKSLCRLHKFHEDFQALANNIGDVVGAKDIQIVELTAICTVKAKDDIANTTEFTS
ncbi:hypothetical protein DFH08DRAFT_975775 [Mycena albidolilacea]|uniref:Uncharacterized protein n=1 Tax=Mycena albidolilacea TaxID=1033008 RepID=A0AAD6Z4A6_9AGAR|nr:hypothetical protein DFH08DRAFT_975775 [Mycena albidolilacea]